jgi:nitrite reductase/ring-hydroxylating ferredoxin subunit
LKGGKQVDRKRNDTIPAADDNYTHNIDKENERRLDRRGFLKTMVGAAGVFAVSTLPWGTIAAKELAGLGGKAHPRVKIADANSVRIGEAVEFAYPHDHDSALLIRMSATEWKAYQNACTHLRCPVYWEKSSSELLCPCHHGKFDPRSGTPLAGPPRRPLPEIVLEQSGGAVFATGVKPYEA